MRLRLNHTGSSEDRNNHVVEIESPSDDLTIYQLWEQLIAPALLGLGYHPDSVNQVRFAPDKVAYFPEDAPEPEATPPLSPTIDLEVEYKTRSGLPVTNLKFSTDSSFYPVRGLIDGTPSYWTLYGRWFENGCDNALDLIPTGRRAAQ